MQIPQISTGENAHTTKIDEAMSLEREAHHLRGEGKIDQAFHIFDQAAKLYQESGEHLKSAVCYASAATCWNIHTGWQPLKNAATRSELAGVQAYEARDYAYAENLFNEAALLYEKEGDFTKYSSCFIRAKDARLLDMWGALMKGGLFRRTLSPSSRVAVSWKTKTTLAFRCFLSVMSRITWGYGEKPFQTMGIAVFIILMSAVCYSVSGQIILDGVVGSIGFLESLYLSVVTYSTVGYGDYLPFGWTRAVAGLEALSGILLTPLFLIALTRRYLRISR